MRDTVAELIDELPAWQLSALLFNERVARRMGIVSSDLQCLFALDRGGPSSPTAISERVGLTTGSASRMVERLARTGLVDVSPDPHDRRRVVVRITPSASRDLHACFDPLDDRLRELLGSLDASALAQFADFVRAARDATIEQGAHLGPQD